MHTEEHKWLWVDLEMTGLDPAKHRIVEAAAIVTDTNLQELATWHAVIRHPQEVLDEMKDSDWFDVNKQTGTTERVGSVYDMLSQSGVLEAIDQFGRDESEVEVELAAFIAKHFDGQAILAGNSIAQDRRFIRAHWKQVEEQLHYRMLDVTAFKVALLPRGIVFEKQKAHNALDDIRASIAELDYYLSHVR